MFKFVKRLMCQHEFVATKLNGVNNEFMRCNYLIECIRCGKFIRANYVSDGYHSFEELYKHRNELFIALMKKCPEISFWTRLDNNKNNDPGWIIVGMNLKGGQISYHIPDTYIEKLSGIKEIEFNEKYDGHDSNDVLTRLERFKYEDY